MFAIMVQRKTWTTHRRHSCKHLENFDVQLDLGAYKELDIEPAFWWALQVRLDPLAPALQLYNCVHPPYSCSSTACVESPMQRSNRNQPPPTATD